jgi:hypothetical protein
MASALRLEYASAIYHVDRQEAIFLDDVDRGGF